MRCFSTVVAAETETVSRRWSTVFELVYNVSFLDVLFNVSSLILNVCHYSQRHNNNILLERRENAGVGETH